MLIFCSTFDQIGFYGDRCLIWICPTYYSWAVLGCNAFLLSQRLRDVILHPSFLWKAHSVPVSLFYFSHPLKRTGENLKALQLVTIGQNCSTECHTLKADLLFSPKNQRLFCFCLWLCWVSIVYRLPALELGSSVFQGRCHFSRSAAWVLCTFPSACPLEFQLHGFWRLSEAEPRVTFGVFFLSHLALTPTPLTYTANILPHLL